jgi:hypothetical protein
MQGCNPLLLCRRPTRIHSGFLPLVPTATVLFCPFEAALPRRTQDAEAICRQILSVEPRHAESLHLLGVFALHAGRHELADGDDSAGHRAVAGRFSIPLQFWPRIEGARPDGCSHRRISAISVCVEETTAQQTVNARCRG